MKSHTAALNINDNVDVTQTIISHNNFTIRLARDEDFESIFHIWTEGLSQSFDTSAIDVDDLRLKFERIFKNRNSIFNYWIAVNENGEIMGWQSLNKCTVNPLKENHFAESSTYVRKAYRKYGVGELLLKHVIDTAATSELHYITAFINVENTAIRKITNNLGFVENGLLPQNSKQSNGIDKLFIIKPL